MLTDFETCADAVSRICRPWRLASPRCREFRGSIRNFTAASLNVTALSLGRSRMSQDPGIVMRDGEAYYSLLFQARGAARIAHERGETVMGPGDFALLHSRSSATVEVSDGTQQYSLNFFHPRDVARLDVIRDRACRRISHGPGAQALLGDVLRSAIANARHLECVDLRETTVELLLAALGAPRGSSSHGASRVEVDGNAIVRYIDAHLREATLDPRRIAAHFAISLRQVYRVTAATGSAPAALIWERRLRLARELLRGGKSASITRVAHECGFSDSAHFARAYRRAFGETPSASRRAR